MHCYTSNCVISATAKVGKGARHLYPANCSGAKSIVVGVHHDLNKDLTSIALLIQAICERCTKCKLIPRTSTRRLASLNNALTSFSYLLILESWSRLLHGSCVLTACHSGATSRACSFNTKVSYKDQSFADGNLLIAGALPPQNEHHSMLSGCSNVGLVTRSSDFQNDIALASPIDLHDSSPHGLGSLAWIAKSVSLLVPPVNPVPSILAPSNVLSQDTVQEN